MINAIGYKPKVTITKHLIKTSKQLSLNRVAILRLRKRLMVSLFAIRLAKIYSSINNINITNHGTVMTVSVKKKVFFDMVFDDGADVAFRFDLVGRNISIIALIE